MANISCKVLEEFGQFGKNTVSVVEWNGKPCVDIRSWYQDADGNTKPGRGITLKLAEVDNVVEAIQSAKEFLEGLNG